MARPSSRMGAGIIFQLGWGGGGGAIFFLYSGIRYMDGFFVMTARALYIPTHPNFSGPGELLARAIARSPASPDGSIQGRTGKVSGWYDSQTRPFYITVTRVRRRSKILVLATRRTLVRRE